MAELNRRNIHDVANAFHFSTVERVLTLVMSSGLRETYRPLGALAETAKLDNMLQEWDKTLCA